MFHKLDQEQSPEINTLPNLEVAGLKELKKNPEEIKNYLFDEFMKNQLLNDFFQSLQDYFSSTQIDEMRRELINYSPEQIYAALSLPAELRDRKFTEFEQKIESGLGINEIVHEFIEKSFIRGFGVGYHTSAVDIRPDENGSWFIKGTEADHRDDNKLMAYYSTQYRHLYKKSNSKFIYIVRVDPSSHRNDGNWHRASALSVVARVPFEKVVRYVETTAKMATSQEEVAM